MRIDNVGPTLKTWDDIMRAYLPDFDTCRGSYFAGSVSFDVDNFSDISLSRTITLDNVRYLPSCTINLVSDSQLYFNGYRMYTSESGLCTVHGEYNCSLATARVKKWTILQ